MKKTETAKKIEEIVNSVELATNLSLKELKWLKRNESFKILAGINRGITPKHVTKIAKSIRKYGMLRPVIVVETNLFSGKKERYIIDGQHSYNACLSLGIEIPYVVINNLNTIEDIIACIASFNASSKSWTTFDYVYAWAAVKEDYRQLNQLYEQFDLEFDTILTATTSGYNSASYAQVRNGEFAIESYEKAHAICQRITDVFEIIPRLDRFSNRILTRACASIFKKSSYTPAKHAKLLNYITEHLEELSFVVSDSTIVKDFLSRGI
jgi:hypothetical protein